VEFSINGSVGVPISVELGHCVYTDDESPNGTPQVDITTSPFDLQSKGMLPFWPNPKQFLSGTFFALVPQIILRSQAIQLGGMFAAALHVTDGVAAYASRRAAILTHYQSYVNDWIDWAAGWSNTNDCGDSYHGLNIAFIPAWLWAQYEPDATRKARIQTEVLRDAMWSEVSDHKNVFFAYIYASQAPAGTDTTAVVSSHTDQLRQFPVAPNLAVPVDNTGSYAEDPSCPGLSSTAIDVGDRVPATFLWERNPWKLQDPGAPNYVYSGVDYLIAYWMARHYGYLTDDSPDQCLRWRAE